MRLSVAGRKFPAHLFGCVLVLLLSLASPVSTAEEIRDYYAEPGINPFKDAINQTVAEHIDPFSGTLQLKYTDIRVPGNGGLDININRVYTSLQSDAYPLLSVTGLGWVMHFGRIVVPADHLGKICQQGQFSLDTRDNPSLELPDGGRELLVVNSIDNDGSLITRSNWRAQCVAGQAGMVVSSPDGTRYVMDHLNFVLGEPSWMTTRIEDVHGNWIRIDYRVNAAGISYIHEIYRSEEGAATPVVKYEYNDIDQAGITLASIEANGQLWEYEFEPIPGFLSGTYHQLTAVERPDGRRWQYEYNPAPHDPDPNDGVIGVGPGGWSIAQVTYPHGATIDYTYQFVAFDPGSSLQTTAIHVKNVSGGGVVPGQWTFTFAPHSFPFSDPEHPETQLRQDVTTVSGPEAQYRYYHFGKDFVGIPGGFAFIRPSFVGLLAQKETLSPSGTLLERRAYSWGIRQISEENYWHGAGYRSWWNEQASYAPILLAEGYNRDNSVGLSGYLNIRRYENHDAYGNPQRIFDSTNIGGQESRRIELTYRNDVSQWILGQPLTETYGYASSPTDDSPVPAGEITRTYFGNGSLKTETRFGVETKYTYTSAGDLASVEDAKGNIRRYLNYRRGIPRREEHPESVVLLREVNSSGTVSSATNGRGYTTAYEYDDLNRLTAIDYPTHASVGIEYSAAGEGFSRILTRGNYRQTEVFNDFGQRTRLDRVDLASGQTITTNVTLDERGRAVFVSYPNSANGTTTTYDALDRVTRQEHPDHYFVGYTYRDQEVTVLNERGYSTIYLYRTFGTAGDARQLWLVSQPRSIRTLIERDMHGNTTRVFQGELRADGLIYGYEKSFEYDSRFFLTSASEPESGKTGYTHDAVGNVLTQTPHNSPSTTFVWDNLYRRVAVNYSDATPDISTVYDANGNVRELRKGNSFWLYAYDENDNLRQETLTLTDKWFRQRQYVVQHDYDVLDSVAATTYPSSLVVAFAPDAFGRPTRAGTFATNVLYHPTGQVSSYTLANGITTTITLNQRQQTERINAASLVDLTYAYDPTANVWSITDAIVPGSSVFNNYDELDRLQSARGAWGQQFYEYDVHGNFTRLRQGTDTFRYSLDAQRRLRQMDSYATNENAGNQDDVTQLDYDRRGNVAAKRFYNLVLGGTQGYVAYRETKQRFDAAANLVAMRILDTQPPGGFGQPPIDTDRDYEYDGNGMRFADREPRQYRVTLTVHGADGQLLFDDSLSECVRTDYIRLGAVLVASSKDTYGAPQTDSDGDGINNCLETQFGLNANDASDAAGDLDGDGLSNLQEIAARSSLLVADTDGDGLSDAAERNTHHSDPLQSDSDGDGIADDDEVLAGMNPSLEDSDHDGVSDEWEDKLQTSSNDPTDALQDFDNDGFTNRQESNAGTDPRNLAESPARGTLGWRAGVNGAVVSQPVLGKDGLIYVTTTRNFFTGSVTTLYALHPDGTIAWTYAQPFGMSPPSVAPDGGVYVYLRFSSVQVGDPRSMLLAFTPSGALRWSYPSTDSFESAISIGHDGKLLVGATRNTTSNGAVLVLDRDGNLLQARTTSGSVTTAPVMGTDGSYYVAGSSGQLYAFATDGTQRWTYGMRGTAAAELSLGQDGTLYAVDSARYTYAIRADGTLAWERNLSAQAQASGVVVGDAGTLYVGTSDSATAGRLLSLNAADGTTLRTLSFDGAVNTPVIGQDETLYAVTRGGRVAAYDATGQQLWTTTLGSLVGASPAIDRDGTMYVGTLRGQLMTVIERGGLGRTAWPMTRHDVAGSAFHCFDSRAFSVTADTDGDGMNDCIEMRYGLDASDPADAQLDLDGDGLRNVEEVNAGTRLDVQDTDGDGLRDGEEVLAFHTSPLLVDTDGDSLADGYEVQYQFDPLDAADAVADADGDGFSNRQEMRAGTDPLNGGAMPQTGGIVAEATNASMPARRPAEGRDRTIYVNGNNQIEALASDLTVKWTWPETPHGHVAVGSDGLLYAVTRNASNQWRFLVLYPDGRLRWSYNLPGGPPRSNVDGPIVGSNGTVYFTIRSPENFLYNALYAFNPNGTVTKALFAVVAQTNDPQQRISIGPDGSLLMHHAAGLAAFDPATLTQRWTVNLSAGEPSIAISDAQAIYIVRPDGMRAIRPSDGGILWQNADVSGQPVLTEEGLIVARCRASGQLCAWDGSGASVWQSSGSFPLLGAAVVDASNTIHQLTSNGAHLRFSSQGLSAPQVTIPALTALEYPLVLHDGSVYVGAAGRHWISFNPGAGEMTSRWPMPNRDATNRRNASAPVAGPVVQAPQVVLMEFPPGGMSFRQSVVVTATANDFQEGVLTPQIEWRSDRDGLLGQGGSVNLSVLSGGQQHAITATVRDAQGNVGSATFNIQVSYRYPSFNNIIPGSFAKLEIGVPSRFSAEAVDQIDGDISNQIHWVSNLDGEFGVGRDFTATLRAGQHTVDLSVTNSVGLTAHFPMTITVEHVPPTITIVSPSGSLEVPHGTPVVFRGVAEDILDGNLNAQLRWRSNLEGLLYTGETFTSTTLSVGNHGIYAEATDSHGLTGSASTSVAITDPANPDNLFPFGSAFISPSGQSNYGQTLNMNVQAQDNDGQIVGPIRWFSNRDGEIGAGTAFSISTLSVGNHEIWAVFADDLGAKAASWTVFHTVRSNVPTISITAPASGASFLLGANVTFTGTASDIEDGTISNGIVWSSNLDGVLGTGASLTVNTLRSGSHTITASITDSHGRTATRTRGITIQQNQTPNVTITTPVNGATFASGALVSFNATATDAEDGTLTSFINWSSTIDGAIGSTGQVSTSTLSVGTHTITASARDSRNATGSKTITVVIAPAGSTLLSDNFSDNNFNGWTVVTEPGTSSGPGVWSASTGALRQTSGVFSSPTTAETVPKPGTYIHYAAGTSWTNYTLEADLRSTDADAFGVMFRYQNSNNYYRFSMDRTLSQRRLVKKVGGTYTVLREDSVRFNTSQTYRLSVSVNGSAITVLIDGVQFYSGTDTSLTSGSVAMYTWRNSGATFDNVVVFAIAQGASAFDVGNPLEGPTQLLVAIPARRREDFFTTRSLP
jgi:YD repeat-containing protein